MIQWADVKLTKGSAVTCKHSDIALNTRSKTTITYNNWYHEARHEKFITSVHRIFRLDSYNWGSCKAGTYYYKKIQFGLISNKLKYIIQYKDTKIYDY